jgi:hypothetical protein
MKRCHGLTVLPDGDLVVAVSRERPSHIRFARLQITRDGVERTAWLLLPNRLLIGDVRGNDKVLQFLDDRGEMYAARSIDLASFHPAPSLGKGWICP